MSIDLKFLQERARAIEACAKAGWEAAQKAGADALSWDVKEEGFGSGSKAIDVACTEQILSGKFDNAKVAELAFVEAVLAEARRHEVLAADLLLLEVGYSKFCGERDEADDGDE